MMDAGQIAALVGSLKTAGEITAALISFRDAGVVEAKARELNGVIIAAQASAIAAHLSQMELLDRVRTLEAEVARMKEWDAGKGAYKLKALAPGAFAYAYQPSVDGSEPPHWLCVNCYNDRQKSVLQAKPGMDKRMKLWACPKCGSEIVLPWGVHPQSAAEAQTAPEGEG